MTERGNTDQDFVDVGVDRPGYIEATVVWEGAVDEEREFPLGSEALEAWAQGVIAEGRAKGERAEIFIVVHEHEPFEDGEDTCAQYLTDHHPTWTTEEGRP